MIFWVKGHSQWHRKIITNESSFGWTVLFSCFETSLPMKPRLVSRLKSSFRCFPSVEIVGLHLSSSTWLESTCKTVPNLFKNSELFQKVFFYLDLEKHPALYSSCNLMSVLIQNCIPWRLLPWPALTPSVLLS